MASELTRIAGRRLEAIWQAGQPNMLDLSSSNNELILAEKSGHMVIHDQKELVIRAILSVLEEKS